MIIYLIVFLIGYSAGLVTACVGAFILYAYFMETNQPHI